MSHFLPTPLSLRLEPAQPARAVRRARERLRLVGCGDGCEGRGRIRASLARDGASLEATEVTLNADVSSHSLTADGVVFDYYDASAVAITSTEPLGGPAAGGTVVTVRGSGFVDRGGVHCRFGSATEAVVPATLRSATELVCVSPTHPLTTHPLDVAPSYARVHDSAHCCAADADPLLAERLGSLPSVASAAACHAACAGDPRCRYFSHGAAAASPRSRTRTRRSST